MVGCFDSGTPDSLKNKVNWGILAKRLFLFYFLNVFCTDLKLKWVFALCFYQTLIFDILSENALSEGHRVRQW